MVPKPFELRRLERAGAMAGDPDPEDERRARGAASVRAANAPVVRRRSPSKHS